MNKFLFFLLLAQPVFAQNNVHIDHAKQYDFVLKNFNTESGVVLPEAHVISGTYGKLNAAHDNAVLLPSHYMADHQGYEWLIGAGHA